MDSPNILLSSSQNGWKNYENAVRHAGGVVGGGYCPAVETAYDGLILCGGDDIAPALFGQADAGSEGIDPARDAAELALAKAFLAAGKPILGICRGLQVLNVALGGTLIQDLGPQRNLFHRQTPGNPEDKVHAVCAAEGSLLCRLYGSVFSTNSSHHQAVDQLGDDLRATAWSESGVVEALEHAHLPVWGVQFHPERMAYDYKRPDTADGSALFEHFLRCCRAES